jgi:tRNA-splicing ligase RtcB
MSELRQITEVLWEIPATARADMRVPARVFADQELLEAIEDDGSLEQLENVATLPGVVGAALAMPDVHQGYGFPVGGVAAMELPDGVVSPGGVGYDINCGVRLLALPLGATELGERRKALVHEISGAVPAGAGKTTGRARRGAELDAVLRYGRGASALPTISSAPSPGAAYPAPTRRPSPNERASEVPGNSGRWAPATTSSRSSGLRGSSM